MSDTLVVALGGRVAGTLTRDREGARFTYEDDYRSRPGSTPLSVSMPLQVAAHRTSVVTPCLWGLLPENAEVLERWARRFQVSAASPFSLLSSPVGEDCAGAAQFAAPDRAAEVIERHGSIEWLSEDDLAARLRALRADAAAWLGPDFTGRFTLAGAQAKTALFFDGSRWGVPSGATPTTHILKPAIAGLDDHDLNEHLCLDAAGRAGLLVVRTRVLRVGDVSAVAILRYDRRDAANGVVTRVHQEDLCQALGVTPSRKYEADGGPGPARIARLLRDVVRPAPAAEEAVWRFFDALAWNWLIGGTDAHAKNYSLLLSGDQVRLAPLYDLASILPYEGVDERKLKMAMKLGGEYRLKAHGPGTWAKVAAELHLDVDAAHARVVELASAAPDAFADAAAATEVRRLRRPLTRRLVDAVADRARRCGALLGGPQR